MIPTAPRRQSPYAPLPPSSAFSPLQSPCLLGPAPTHHTPQCHQLSHHHNLCLVNHDPRMLSFNCTWQYAGCKAMTTSSSSPPCLCHCPTSTIVVLKGDSVPCSSCLVSQVRAIGACCPNRKSTDTIPLVRPRSGLLAEKTKFSTKPQPFLGKSVMRTRSQGMDGKLAETSLAHISEIASTIRVQVGAGWEIFQPGTARPTDNQPYKTG